MVILTNVSLQFDGVHEHLENSIRQVQGVANLWTITIWMKPLETQSLFDSDNRPLFKPDGKALVHFKGATHRNEILVWAERIDNSVDEEFIIVENWDESGKRIRITRFNMAQRRKEWRNFSCSWNGANLIAWNDGVPITDFSETFSGIGSFVMDDPATSGRLRSVRVAAAYSGISTTLDGPRLVSYSGMLGPVGIWDEVLDVLELGAIASDTFAFDLTTNSGNYTSSVNLQHWWRLGADSADIGKDYATPGNVDLGIDATVTGTNIVVDSP